jgi:hypothetical protein
VRFGFQVLLWLPLMFYAWYGLGDLNASALAPVGEKVLLWLLPNTIHSVEARGDAILVSTRLRGATDATKRLAVRNRPRQQGYGLALYAALTMVPELAARQLLSRMLAGILLTLLLQLLGLVSGVIDQLLFRGVTGVPDLDELPRQLVFNAHAFIVLVLPTLAPVLLWIALNMGFVRGLAGNAGPAKET